MGRVRFLNTGADQIPGLIVMEVSDEVEGMRPIDENFRRVVVVINAAPDEVVFEHAGWKGVPFERHPVQVSSADEVAKQAAYDGQKAKVTVPGRTTAVFVVPR